MKQSENKQKEKLEAAPIKLPNIAEFLKEKRMTKNLTLERLSDLTKIQVYHLKALEDGKIDDLPPLVYRDGIFKRIAKFLEVSEDEILKLYKKESRPADENIYASKAILQKKDFYFILTPKNFAVFFGAILLIFLSTYLWYQFNFLVGPPTLAIEPKEDLVIKNEILQIRGKTDSGVNLTVNGESVYVSSDGNFEKSVQLAAGINVIEVNAVNSYGKITKIIRQVFREQ